MKRYHGDLVLIERRKCFAISHGIPSHVNFRKRKPGDCGHVRCSICHYDKYYGKGRFDRALVVSVLRLVEWAIDI